MNLPKDIPERPKNPSPNEKKDCDGTIKFPYHNEQITIYCYQNFMLFKRTDNVDMQFLFFCLEKIIQEISFNINSKNDDNNEKIIELVLFETILIKCLNSNEKTLLRLTKTQVNKNAKP